MKAKCTPEIKAYIKNNYQKYSYAELTAMVNARFETDIARSTLLSLACRNNLRKKSNNKIYQVGDERINNTSITMVKIAVTGPPHWKEKHRLIWEQAHGPIPKGHVIIFLDGNKSNFALNNLYMLSHTESVRMNQYGLRSANSDITLAGIALVKHSIVIHDRLEEKLGDKEHKLFNNEASRKRVRERKRATEAEV